MWRVWLIVLALGCAGVPERPGPLHKPTRGDLGVLFQTVDEAALAGCDYIWRHYPLALHKEYCGVIYRDAEGIKAGLPETNDRAGYCYRPIEPTGTEAEAGYHNHKDTPEFSYDDRNNPTPLSMYLCTPSGIVKRRTAEGTVIVR
jgi:hypothetical protein